MEHTNDYSYEDIEAYIRRANQLRSQALGELFSAGWAAGKRLYLHLLHREQASRQPVKQSSTHGLAY